MSERNSRKTKVGVVVSNKMDKTITVSVEDFVRHTLYGSSRLTTKRMSAALVIQLRLWKQDLSARIRDGDLLKS